jgi:hypothetical protein
MARKSSAPNPWERRRWMACMHDIGLVGLISDEN